MQLKLLGSVLEDLLTALGKKIKPKVFPPNKGDADCAEEQHRHLGLVSGQKSLKMFSWLCEYSNILEHRKGKQGQLL